jgi:alanyl-tRNA synthetase
VDLTRLMGEERGLKVDIKTYLEEETRAKELSRAVAKEGSSQFVTLSVHHIDWLEKSGIKPSDDHAKYRPGVMCATVQALLLDSEFVDTVKADQLTNTKFGIVLDATNFYAEQGGQIYDIGTLQVMDDQGLFIVESTQNSGGYVLHSGYLKHGHIRRLDKVICAYDEARRQLIRNNHTATHLLNFVLRNLLGESVDQKGSLVAPDRLRFDFTHKRALSVDEIVEIEKAVQRLIDQDIPVHHDAVSLELGKQIHGLRAVFGEVYPDPVRIISVGLPLERILQNPTNPDWSRTSLEFCGGTHVHHTGEIHRFYITDEEAIAKGIRRIVAITGEEACRVELELGKFAQRVKTIETLPEKTLAAEITNLLHDLELLRIPLNEKLNYRRILNSMKDSHDKAEKLSKTNLVNVAVDHMKRVLNGQPSIPFIVDKLTVGSNTKALLQAINHVKQASPHTAVLLLSVDDDATAVSYVCHVPDALVTRGLKATEWSKTVANKVGGKFGGKDNSAQGMGTEISRVDDALDLARDFAKIRLSSQ